MIKLSIIIPAYNEQNRIHRTLETYYHYFMSKRSDSFDAEFIIVLNGCTDNTYEVVHSWALDKLQVYVLNEKQGGKGYAIKVGFQHALQRDAHWIGYVDADMATRPEYFFALLQQRGDADGVIASRYMPGADIEPKRPFIKRWGSKLIYEPLIWMLFGMRFYDYQCGAKIFKREVIVLVAPKLTIRQWAFDVELLYLCKKYGFLIKEVPTVWRDQDGSKLDIAKAGSNMIPALFKIYQRHHH